MKTTIAIILAAALVAGTSSSYAQSDVLKALMERRAREAGGGAAAADAATPDASAAPDAPAAAEPVAAAETFVEAAPGAEAVVFTGLSTNGITMNFNNAPVATVLKYMSAAAGFHIIMETPARGTVTVISSHPMTKEEAVDLLNAVLNKNNLVVIPNGNFLTVMDKAEARGRNLPVKTWDKNPKSIPNNEEMVTQILPISFVEARTLATDLSSFVSPNATIIANEAANSIVITDTQSNIRHLTEIIKAIDSSAEGETQVQVFPLKFANPSDVATLLAGIFPNDSSGQNVRFGGGGGRGGGLAGFFGGGGAAGGGATTSASSQNRIKKQTQVIAVADLRTSSVAVTASRDQMTLIASLIEKLDVSSDKDPDVHVASLPGGADPQAVLQVLQNMFPQSPNSRTATTTQNANSALAARITAAVNGMRSTTSTTASGSTGVGAGGNRGGGALR